MPRNEICKITWDFWLFFISIKTFTNIFISILWRKKSLCVYSSYLSNMDTVVIIMTIKFNVSCTQFSVASTLKKPHIYFKRFLLFDILEENKEQTELLIDHHRKR